MTKSIKGNYLVIIGSQGGKSFSIKYSLKDRHYFYKLGNVGGFKRGTLLAISKAITEYTGAYLAPGRIKNDIKRHDMMPEYKVDFSAVIRYRGNLGALAVHVKGNKAYYGSEKEYPQKDKDKIALLLTRSWYYGFQAGKTEEEIRADLQEIYDVYQVVHNKEKKGAE